MLFLIIIGSIVSSFALLWVSGGVSVIAAIAKKLATTRLQVPPPMRLMMRLSFATWIVIFICLLCRPLPQESQHRAGGLIIVSLSGARDSQPPPAYTATADYIVVGTF